MKYLVAIFLLMSLNNSVFSQNLDVRILDAINSKEAKPSDNFFKLISNTNTPVNIGIPAGLAVIGYANNDKVMMRNACVMVAGSAINLGLTLGIKYTVNRKRPFQSYPNQIFNKVGAGDPSFPSGHTSSAFATATSFSLAYPKWYVIVPSYTWAGAVAYSRMHLGVHYPTDVLVGIIVGVGSAFLAYKADKWIYNHCSR